MHQAGGDWSRYAAQLALEADDGEEEKEEKEEAAGASRPALLRVEARLGLRRGELR